MILDDERLTRGHPMYWQETNKLIKDAVELGNLRDVIHLSCKVNMRMGKMDIGLMRLDVIGVDDEVLTGSGDKSLSFFNFEKK